MYCNCSQYLNYFTCLVILSNCCQFESMEANRKINLFFLTHITDSKEDTTKFCKDINLLPKVVRCPNCKCIPDTPYFMKRSNSKSEDIRYKCGQKICKEKGSRNSISVKTGTWFGKCHFSLQKSLFFDLLFCLQDVIFRHN